MLSLSQKILSEDLEDSENGVPGIKTIELYTAKHIDIVGCKYRQIIRVVNTIKKIIQCWSS